MPYIDNDARQALDPLIDDLTKAIMSTAQRTRTLPDGLFNYAVTRLVFKLWHAGYTDFVHAVGNLVLVALEFHRRVVAPYEDRKKKEQGDVF